MKGMNRMDLSEKIKYHRRFTLGISQDDLANLLSVTRGTIINWEGGISKPTTANIMALATVFSVTTDYLIFENHPYELSLKNLNDEEYEILKRIINVFNKKDM